MPSAPSDDDAEQLALCQGMATALTSCLLDDALQLQALRDQWAAFGAAAARVCHELGEHDLEVQKLATDRAALSEQLHKTRQADLRRALRQLGPQLQGKDAQIAALEVALKESRSALESATTEAGRVKTLEEENFRLTALLDTQRSRPPSEATEDSLEAELAELRQNNATNVELIEHLQQEVQRKDEMNARLLRDLAETEPRAARHRTDTERAEGLARRVEELMAELAARSPPPTVSVACQAVDLVPPLPLGGAPHAPPPTPAPDPPSPEPQVRQRLVLGLEVSFHGEEGRPLSVVVVKPDGPAARAGLQVGDVLVQWGPTPIPTSKAEFEALLKQHQIGDTVALHVRREGHSLTLPLTLGGADATPSPRPSPSPKSHRTSQPSKPKPRP